MSQEQLASASGLHKGTIYLLEKGLREPRYETIVRLAGALECEPAVFFEDVRWIPASKAPAGTYVFDTPDLRPAATRHSATAPPDRATRRGGSRRSR